MNSELAARLWAKVDRRSPDECWIWTAYLRPDGYGELGIPKIRKTILAHRAAWIVTNGPLPTKQGFHGAVVMHLCDNPACCNPLHLTVGTQKENIRDCRAKGRGVSPIGSGNGKTKYSETDTAFIRNSSLSGRELAKMFNTTPQYISNIRVGKRRSAS